MAAWIKMPLGMELDVLGGDANPSPFAPVKPEWFTFLGRLTQVVLEKKPLSGRSSCITNATVVHIPKLFCLKFGVVPSKSDQ